MSACITGPRSPSAARRIQDMDTGTAVNDPALMAFQDRVGATLDPALAADAAEVTVTLTDGTRHTSRIDHGIGSAARPKIDGMAVLGRIDFRTCAPRRATDGLEFAMTRQKKFQYMMEKCQIPFVMNG